MLLTSLFEAIARTGKGNTAVVGWGRGMGHKGHMMLASSVIHKAKEVGGDPYFVVSRTVGKDDPLDAEEKLAIYKKVFPQQGHIFQAASDELPDLTRVLGNLNKQGYSNAIVVVGADQVKAFQYLKNYNGKPDKAGNIAFNFDNLDVISRQETGDPSAGEEGPRATPMRDILNDPSATPQQQFKVWRDAMSSEVSDDEVRQLMIKAKERMTQFSAPKKKTKTAEETQVDEKWSEKYKHSINCSHPKGFSQRAHCQGRKKHSESTEMVCPDCGLSETMAGVGMEPHASEQSKQYRGYTGGEGYAENFANGKNPGRKGLAKRSGVPTKASVSKLRSIAKHSTGEKARMAHWMANMKAGKAKKESIDSNLVPLNEHIEQKIDNLIQLLKNK